MPIIPCTDELMGEAESLVTKVFPSMTLVERMSFLAIKRPESLAGRLLMWLARVKSKVAFDVYIDESGAVLGTTGLYQYNKDAQEAVWVAWFCVDPQTRGKGIGQKLIVHTISMAAQAGFRRVRLYTSTDPNEEAAQRLYEKNGFKETSRKEGLFTTKIFREREIKPSEQGGPSGPLQPSASGDG
jgi:GNAT superfamily N-acetyltransferase